MKVEITEQNENYIQAIIYYSVFNIKISWKEIEWERRYLLSDPERRNWITKTSSKILMVTYPNK